MPTDLVLIGFDGTPAAERAVREAGALFAPRPALVVTIWEPGRAFDLALVPARGFELPLSSVDIRTATEVDRALYREAQQLARWGAQLATDSGLRADGLAVADDLTVTDTLVRLARERDSAVIVLGTHRHGRLAKLLLGSTSRGVIEHAPCPVLIVRGH
ncbi:MAG TPA: universal stress protein [Actinophytocola sp.]|uniref:universal stress protein n=1 Tax=Actinophytocola sp. TaxID=1872138 RepID=UPI002DDD7BE5|nr:universal stress protein [Actinophytocola sp.]HEV2784157.1 universal stress protein [Actinophytocola sp.]